MDFAEQLRVLEAAKGDPARLGLATVDLAHGRLPDEQRATLKKALQGAAMPHWIDQCILATLLSSGENEAAEVLAQLRVLNVVEPFPARGERAVNVHETTRKALRKMLLQEHPELFRSFSARARECFVDKSAFHMRIEALYHLFAADQDAAAIECMQLDTEATLIAGPQSWLALAAVLNELLAEGWLRGRALLEALLSVQECQASRSVTIDIDDATHTLDVARHLNDLRGAARAHALVGYIRRSQGELDLALDARRESLALYQCVVSEDPNDLDRQRELNAARSKLGDILFQQKRFDEALAAFREALAGFQTLVSKDPSHAGWQREAATSHSKVGDIFVTQGRLDDALKEFRQYQTGFERLVAKNPDNANWQRELSISHSRLGDVSFGQGDIRAALAAYQQSTTIGEDLIAKDPANVGWQRDLSICRCSVGVALALLGRREEATAILHEAEKQARERIGTGSITVQSKKDLAAIRQLIEALARPHLESERDSKTDD